VKRGKWILEAILGAPPPPPPPNAGTLKEDDGPAVRRPVRDRLERHRRDPNCAGCHRRMDPLGLALEGFDAIGRVRRTEGPQPPRDGAESWDFDVDGNFEGWSFGYYGGELNVKGGTLNVPVTADDIRIFGPPIAKTAAQTKVTVRLRNSTPATKLTLSYLSPAEIKWEMFGIPQGWKGNKAVTSPIEPNGDFAEVTFDLSKNKDEIACLMLSATNAKGSLQIDWIRTGDGAAPPPVDVAGALPNGRKVRGPEELKRLLLAEHRDDFVRAFVGHLLTYALGRPLESYDMPVVQDISKAVAADGYKFSRVVVEVAKSFPFLNRRTLEAKDHE